MNVSVPVQFQIRDLHAWVYNHTDAAGLLERLATREVVRYLASVDIFQLMGTGRAEAAEDLRGRIQKQADAAGLGANVVLVGLHDLHPPGKVAPKFEEVVATLQENEARINEADGYAFKAVTLAKADAERRMSEARSYSNRTVSAAVALGGQFTNQVMAYRASPRVYMERTYLQALERGMTNARKYVLATTNTQDIIQMNVEDKVRGDLINDLNIPSAKK